MMIDFDLPLEPCRAEEGHATSFMCTYHGWTYDLKGALVGVPGSKEVYHEELYYT